MKPRTRLEKLVAGLSEKLPAITKAQEEWAKEHVFDHVAYKCKNELWCSECGEIWVNTGNSKLGDKTECPYCHHQLDVKVSRKQKNHEEAYEMIRRLAGRSHQVYTGVCLVKKGPEGEADTVVSFYDETDVNVSPMTEKEIREYADSEEPMDKAGSYAVQGFFARYIDGLKGSYANVMGLPVHLVYQELKKLGAL